MAQPSLQTSQIDRDAFHAPARALTARTHTAHKAPVSAPSADILQLPTDVTQRAARQRIGVELGRTLPALQRYARSLTRNSDDAEDLVQETCLRALDRAAQWDPTLSFDGWVFRVMRNIRISDCRRSSVRLGAGEDPAEEVLIAPHDPEAQAQALTVRRAMAQLPAELREVLELTALEGLSYAETAERLGIPGGTVMSRLHRARAVLKKACGSGTQ